MVVVCRFDCLKALDAYPGGWRAAAHSVEADFRRLDKVMVPLGNRIVVISDTWIMQTGVYNVDFAQINDVDLSIVRSNIKKE